MRSAIARIEHRDPTFHYKATFVGDGDPREVEYELQADGHEIVGTHEGITIASSLGWEGEVLVAAWRISRPDGEMTITFRHELIDEGRRLRAVERLRAPDREQDNVWLFDRR